MSTSPTRSHRRGQLALAAAGAVALATALVAASTPSAGAANGDSAVTTDAAYSKANGATITATDAIRLCGTNRRQQNEPSTAIDPTKTSNIVAGANDYCTVPGAGGTWTGFYRSINGGADWTDSLLPGYPTDDSAEGKASPLHQQGIVNAGDPVQEWDSSGNLFYMGNAFNRDKPQNGSVWVATYDQHAAHYVRTVIVGQGTPAVNGRFNDKTSIGVDRGTTSTRKGNVYAAWSLFQGQGNNEIEFTRSTDHAKTFSRQVKLSTGVKDNQFADIAVTSDGTVYVTWRQLQSSRGHANDAVLFVKSSDGGATFTKPAIATTFDSFDAADTAGTPAAAAAAAAHDSAYAAADGPAGEAGTASNGDSRDCGSGPFACTSGFTFFRHDSSVRVTADPSGDPKTLYAVFDATKPGAVPSTSTYKSAPAAVNGTLMVGQGGVYLTKTTNGGASWTQPSLISDVSVGHQLFPDINADGGYVHALWHDSRNDTCYSVQNAIGDCTAKDAAGFHRASANGLDTYGAVSQNGGGTWSVSQLNVVSQNPDYEMFGNRQVPFHGDYNYVSSVGATAYNVWTDNRQVVAGGDPRFSGGQGFDVKQCRGATAPFTADTCPNAGGLDQDIFGAASGG